MTNRFVRIVSLCLTLLGAWAGVRSLPAAERPHLFLVMTDDQGWGQTGYYGHPILKTPHLDAMAANGLRFDRFYAGAPNCSPTRATVMTGRSNDRTGVLNHGYPLRPQERTLPQLLREAGYATGHFGKWHLNGLRGPGAPVLASDERNPGRFGFDEWLSVTNFFDRDPLLSRNGAIEEFAGDSSEIIVDEALAFTKRVIAEDKPVFAVIWYGSPHSPMVAADDDREAFSELKPIEQHHYGELVAMDRSVGTLRRELRELGIAHNSLVWFCSDNGGLRQFGPATVGGLRGAKNTMYEGGLRVPAIVEWPAVITSARVTDVPAVTMDILPTLAEIAGVDLSEDARPLDGISLRPLLGGGSIERPQPIPFRHTGRAALVQGDYKLIVPDITKPEYQLFNLVEDSREANDLWKEEPQVGERLKEAFLTWNASVERSIAGADYPEGKVIPPDPGPHVWTELPEYQAYFPEWRGRPEFKRWIK